MAIEIGKVISEEVSELLKKFTSSNDRANVSRKGNLSASTLREITYRKQAITLRTFPAVKSMLEQAQKSARDSAVFSRKSEKDLKAILDTI